MVQHSKLANFYFKYANRWFSPSPAETKTRQKQNKTVDLGGTLKFKVATKQHKSEVAKRFIQPYFGSVIAARPLFLCRASSSCQSLLRLLETLYRFNLKEFFLY